jgi:hypothetical protein
MLWSISCLLNDFYLQYTCRDKIKRNGLGRGFKSSHPVHFLLLYNYGIILSSFLLDTFLLSNYSNKKEKLKKKEVDEVVEQHQQLNLLLPTMTSAT